jgi:succinate-semialdehyde dehydrogenase/glutarate-semialdehyde dehydrogenase
MYSSLLKTLGGKTIRMPYQTVNLFNGESVRTFDGHTDQQMEQMLANADNTFREIWSKKAVRDRAKIVGKAASLMLEQKEKFARLATLEMGKRIAESRGEVELSASILKYYAGNAEILPRASTPQVNRRRGLH